jgi:hypothetical protein
MMGPGPAGWSHALGVQRPDRTQRIRVQALRALGPGRRAAAGSPAAGGARTRTRALPRPGPGPGPGPGPRRANLLGRASKLDGPHPSPSARLADSEGARASHGALANRCEFQPGPRPRAGSERPTVPRWRPGPARSSPAQPSPVTHAYPPVAGLWPGSGPYR